MGVTPLGKGELQGSYTKKVGMAPGGWDHPLGGVGGET